MTPTDPTNTLSYGEMNRKQRRKFAKQARMFKGEGGDNFKLMNKAAGVQERHQSEMIHNHDLVIIDDVVGEDEEECQPKPHKAM